MEVEIKAKIENRENVENKLRKLGAIFVGEETEEDIYFQHPSRNFALTDEALRIRNGKVLTYKGPKVDKDTKSREEIEVNIENGNKMRKILKKLGFKPVAKVRKIRRIYKIGEVTVSIDHLDLLGDFVEIECIGEYSSSRHKVFQLATLLELREFIRKSYLELLIEKIGRIKDQGL